VRSTWVAIVLVVLAACGGSSGDVSRATSPAADRPVALVLYDDTAVPAWNADLDSLFVAQLASHFGRWAVKPVAQYRQGDLLQYAGVVYVGSDQKAAIPNAFVDDVIAGQRPVLWLLGNVAQLLSRDPAFATRVGFWPGAIEAGVPVAVEYKGARLPRDARDISMMRGATVIDPAKAQVLATAIRSDGSRLNWAVRSGTLTYVAEVPFSYDQDGDRQLALTDLLFDVFAPATPERHRALIRIEDVSPMTPTASLQALADALHALGAPFSVAVIPVFEDPLGAYFGDGRALEIRMSQSPEFLATLRYMVARGGTLIMHGYTHQYGNVKNPYSGTSGDDFEFWRAHTTDPAQTVVQFDGPILGPPGWAADRVRLGVAEFVAAGLPPPEIFEYPHYAGSAADSRGIQQVFPNAYHRGYYFPGLLAGAEDLSIPLNQAFPYDVTDVFGFRVVPENCGFYSPTLQNDIPRNVPDMLARARNNLVVRDGFASFFFHPWFDPAVLTQLVSGVQGLGYTFVTPGEVLAGSASGTRLP
jgi:uncharacterized protein YdaL